MFLPLSRQCPRPTPLVLAHPIRLGPRPNLSLRTFVVCLGRHLCDPALANAHALDGVLVNTAPLATTPTRRVLKGIVLLEAALHEAAVLPSSVTVMPTQTHLVRGLLSSMQQVLLLACPRAVAMARNSAGPSMSSVTNAIASRFVSQPSPEVSSDPIYLERWDSNFSHN